MFKMIPFVYECFDSRASLPFLHRGLRVRHFLAFRISQARRHQYPGKMGLLCPKRGQKNLELHFGRMNRHSHKIYALPFDIGDVREFVFLFIFPLGLHFIIFYSLFLLIRIVNITGLSYHICCWQQQQQFPVLGSYSV